MLLYLTFHPRMMELIDPRIIEFDSRLTSDLARTTFANSITLTPGTITVDCDRARPIRRFTASTIPRRRACRGRWKKKSQRFSGNDGFDLSSTPAVYLAA